VWGVRNDCPICNSACFHSLYINKQDWKRSGSGSGSGAVEVEGEMSVIWTGLAFVIVRALFLKSSKFRLLGYESNLKRAAIQQRFLVLQVGT
jgi:hypothetical protein